MKCINKYIKTWRNVRAAEFLHWGPTNWGLITMCKIKLLSVTVSCDDVKHKDWRYDIFMCCCIYGYPFSSFNHITKIHTVIISMCLYRNSSSTRKRPGIYGMSPLFVTQGVEEHPVLQNSPCRTPILTRHHMKECNACNLHVIILKGTLLKNWY